MILARSRGATPGIGGEHMKNILLQWTIRDGDNEYDEQVIIETDKQFTDDQLCKKTLEEFYFTTATYSQESGAYELEGDYRLIDEVICKEITDQVKEALVSVNLATVMIF